MKPGNVIADWRRIRRAALNAIRMRGRHTDGFSLVELLVVLVIVGLLAGLVAPQVLGYLGGAKQSSAQAQIKNLESALELYFIDNGQYPTSEDGLSALSGAPKNGVGTARPYIKNIESLRDPWGRPYLYASEDGGSTFKVSSLGRDGREGGEGEDRDLP